MCKVIAICNQKGGCAKTTSAVNIGIGLALNGKKVLLIDSDAQGDLTYLGYSLEILDQLIKKVFSLVRIETDIDIIDDIFEIENAWKASITERQ